MKQAQWIAYAVALASLIPGTLFLYLQIQEDKIVARYMSDRGLASLPLTKAGAIAVSDAVRADFRVDESRFTDLDMARRPFLWQDTAWLLEHREGLCGEGTRVIVNILNELGFDATRITLYDNIYRSAHTLVSVRFEGREFFIDSINSAPRFHELLYTRDVGATDFKVVRYSTNPLERRALARALEADGSAQGNPPPLDGFTLYSYEALPYGKLLRTVGINARAFNLERPPRWISQLAEKPNLILAVGSILAALAADSLLFLFLLIRERRLAR